MFIKKAYVALCATLLFGAVVNAQTTIKSIIKSSDTQEVLSGVTVTNTTTKKIVVTNNKGEFSLEAVKPSQKIKITYYGYESVTLKVNSVPKEIVLYPALESLNQIVLSASRTKEKKHDVPVAISVISKKKLEETQPNDISEVLNQKPGVLMVDLGNEQHMMAIRQPISTKSVFLYLEDGLPIRPTGIFNHNALLETNAAALENIEIIRGAYSSLYGSEAIGGAVNFITEKPSKDLEASVGYRINNLGYKRIEGGILGTSGKTGVYVSGYNSNIKNGFRDYGDFEKSVITAKVNHQFTDKFSIENALTNVKYFSQMSGSIGEKAYKERNYSSLHTFTFRDAEALRITSTLNYEWDEDNNSFLKLFYRQNKMEQNPTYRVGLNRKNGIIYGELNENYFDSYGALFQHNSIVSDKIKYNVGVIVDYTNNDFIAESLIVNKNAEGIYDSYVQTGNFKSDYNAKLLNIGAFGTVEYKLNNNFRWNGGLRVDTFNYDFDNNLGATASSFSSPNTTNTFWSVTPRVGLQ